MINKHEDLLYLVVEILGGTRVLLGTFTSWTEAIRSINPWSRVTEGTFYVCKKGSDNALICVHAANMTGLRNLEYCNHRGEIVADFGEDGPLSLTPVAFAPFFPGALRKEIELQAAGCVDSAKSIVSSLEDETMLGSRATHNSAVFVNLLNKHRTNLAPLLIAYHDALRGIEKARKQSESAQDQ